MSAGFAVGTALVLAALLTVCGAIGSSMSTDPWLLPEGMALAATAAWLVRFICRLRAMASAAQRLGAMSEPGDLEGLAYRVVSDPGFKAFVLGAARPRIWLSDGSLRVLDPGALRAVVLHEEHHRRTRAPLRTAALEAWMATLGRVPGVGRVLEQRLAQIEIDADAYAMQHGARRSDLARALLIADQAAPGTAFSGGAEARVRSLAGSSPESACIGFGRLPVEWLALGLPVVMIAGCRLAWG